MIDNITKLIERLYFPFIRRYVPLETFRYGICGSVNMAFDVVIYFLMLQFVVEKQNLDLGYIVISPHITALLITFPITLTTGFWLARYISFQNNSSSIRNQSIKYMLVVGVNILTKYWGLKFLVEKLYVYPSIANFMMIVITVVISYVLQKKFTFRHKVVSEN